MKKWEKKRKAKQKKPNKKQDKCNSFPMITSVIAPPAQENYEHFTMVRDGAAQFLNCAPELVGAGLNWFSDEVLGYKTLMDCPWHVMLIDADWYLYAVAMIGEVFLGWDSSRVRVSVKQMEGRILRKIEEHTGINVCVVPM